MEVASGSSDGEVPTPKKSSRARTPQSPQLDKKLVVFKLTYTECDNDNDGFLVTVPGEKDGKLQQPSKACYSMYYNHCVYTFFFKV